MKKNIIQTASHLDVLGIGAPLVDQIFHVSEERLAKMPGNKGGMEPVDFPTFTKLLHESSGESKIIPGGSCANTLRGLRQLGHTCGFIGKIGNDSIGDFYLKDLQNLGIEYLCKPSATPTGQVLSFVTPDGERTFYVYLGASLEISTKDLNPTDFNQVRLVHLEGYSLVYPGLVQRAMEYAKKGGSIVSLDLANFEIVAASREVFIDLIKTYVDICFGNEKEIQALTGLSAHEGCKLLRSLCPIAIATMGKKGCWVSQKEDCTFVPTTPIDHPLDTTGAGDLFLSGFLHGYLTGEPIEICARYGVHAGTAIVQVEGAYLNEMQWQKLKMELNIK